MYAVSTFQLARAMNFDFLDYLPTGFAWIALCAWLLTFFGFLMSILHTDETT
jgi:tellurite resistance protein TehA-like permease